MSAVLLLVTGAMAYIAVAVLFVWVFSERRTNSKLALLKECPEGNFVVAGSQSVDRPAFGIAKVEEAVNSFKHGCSCSRVLLETYGPALRLTRGEALDAGLHFAKQMNAAETCGAVTAAFTILALRVPGAGTATMASRAKSRAAICDFRNRFKAKHTTVLCRRLLRAGSSGSPASAPLEPEPDRSLKVCPLLVRDAAEILETMLGAQNRPAQECDGRLAA
jgi:hypothetical protein